MTPIFLIGPGGAGKTTTGSALGARLGRRFMDLDAEFATRFGDISVFLNRFGYRSYSAEKIATFADLVSTSGAPQVIALSSGFMTYPVDSHPEYPKWRQFLANHPLAFVLLPSLEVDLCAIETVKRQLSRPFARSAAMEERVIRERFSIYAELPNRKVETMRPIAEGVQELLAALQSAGPVANSNDSPT